MAQRYALTVQVESHEYYGEFYFVGEGYGTPAEVLDHIAGDHLLWVSDASCIEEYLLDMLNEGGNVSEEEYNATNADVECWIHIDVPYRRYSFSVGDRIVEFSRDPTASEIASKANELQS